MTQRALGTGGDGQAGRVRGWLGKALKLYLVWAFVVGTVAPFALTFGLRMFPAAPPEAFCSTRARAKAVAFPTADGFTLRGVYVRPAEGFPVLLFQHGVRAARGDVAPWARDLADDGYGVLAVDWRGHGESDGWWIGYGTQEGEDVAAMDAFLDAQPELAGRDRAVLAVSLGAATLAQHAARFGPEYRGMVLDSPFGDLGRMIDHQFGVFGPLGWLPKQLVRRVSEVWMGAPVASVVPEVRLAAFAPRPLLVFHGEQDRIVPVSEGRSLLAAYPGPKEGWFTAGDGHTQARATRWEAWMRRVRGFLKEHLRHPPARRG